MSITFFIGVKNESKGYTEPAESCDCSRRWCDDCDAAWKLDQDTPEMYSCDICDAEINMANGNALDLLRWLNLTVDYCGEIPAKELAPMLRRRLWDVERNHDAPMSNDERAESMGLENSDRFITMGREGGYLRQRCEQLLATCERAGDRLIVWA